MRNSLHNLDWFRLREAERLERSALRRDRTARQAERVLGSMLLLVPVGFCLALVGLCFFAAPVSTWEACLLPMQHTRFPEITVRWAELCQAASGAGMLGLLLAVTVRRGCHRLRRQAETLRNEGQQLRREHERLLVTSSSTVLPEARPRLTTRDRPCPTLSITWTGSASGKRSG